MYATGGHQLRHTAVTATLAVQLPVMLSWSTHPAAAANDHQHAGIEKSCALYWFSEMQILCAAAGSLTPVHGRSCQPPASDGSCSAA